MGENHTKGKLKQWAKVTPEQRSILMSIRRKKGWRKKSKKEKLEVGRKLTAARLNKKVINT